MENSEQVIELGLVPLTVDEIEAEMRQYIDPSTYVQFLDMHFQKHAVSRSVQSIATWVYPKRVSEYDDNIADAVEHQTILKRGAALGLRVTHIYLGQNEFDNNLQHATLPDIERTEDMDENTYIHTKGELLANVADYAYDKADMFNPLVENWLEVMALDFDSQQAFKRGFGIVMRYLHQVARGVKLTEIALMEAELLIMGDKWDAAFSELETGPK